MSTFQPSQYVPPPGAVPYIVFTEENGDWEARYGTRVRFHIVRGKGGVDNPPVIPTRTPSRSRKVVKAAPSKTQASKSASAPLHHAGTSKHRPDIPPAAPPPNKQKHSRDAPKYGSSPASPSRSSPRRPSRTPASAAPAPASVSKGTSSSAPPARACRPNSRPAPAPAPASAPNEPTSPSPILRSSRSNPGPLTAPAPASHNEQQAAPSPKANKGKSPARGPKGGVAKTQKPPDAPPSLVGIALQNTKERKRPGRKPSSEPSLSSKSR